MAENMENEVPDFDVPEQLEYSDEHVWVDRSSDPAVLGVTEYAAEQLGELVFVDMPEVGAVVEAGDEVLELESAKAVEPMVCPVAGTIRYVNHDVSDDPSLINSDPYGEGWILKIELDDYQPELLTAEQYRKVVRR